MLKKERKEKKEDSLFFITIYQHYWLGAKIIIQIYFKFLTFVESKDVSFILIG